MLTHLTAYQDVLAQDNYLHTLLPSDCDGVFDLVFDAESQSLATWGTFLPTHSSMPPIAGGYLPTPATLASLAIVRTLVACNRAVFVTGTSCTGKSLLVRTAMHVSTGRSEVPTFNITGASQPDTDLELSTSDTPSHHMRMFLRDAYGATASTTGQAQASSGPAYPIIVDDVHMGVQGNVQTCDALEILRCAIEHGGVRAAGTRVEWTKLPRIAIAMAGRVRTVAATGEGCAGGAHGWRTFSARLQRHFCTIHLQLSHGDVTALLSAKFAR